MGDQEPQSPPPVRGRGAASKAKTLGAGILAAKTGGKAKPGGKGTGGGSGGQALSKMADRSQKPGGKKPGIVKTAATGAAKGAATGAAAGGAGAAPGALLGAAKEVALRADKKKVLALLCVPFLPTIFIAAILFSVLSSFSSSGNHEADNAAAVTRDTTNATAAQLDYWQSAANDHGVAWEVLAAIVYYETGPGAGIGTQPGVCPPGTTPPGTRSPATTAPPPGSPTTTRSSTPTGQADDYCPAVTPAGGVTAALTASGTAPLSGAAPKSVTIVGDSLMDGTAVEGHLQAVLGTAGVTTVNIHTTVGSGLLTTGQGAGSPRHWPTEIPQLAVSEHPDLLVIALGTNDYGAASYGPVVAKVQASIAATQQVLWVLPPQPSVLMPGIANISSQMAAAVVGHPNARTADLNSVVTAHPQWADPGGFHYTPAGYQGFAQFITAAVTGAIPSGTTTATLAAGATPPTTAPPAGVGPFGIKPTALSGPDQAKAAADDWSSEYIAKALADRLHRQPNWESTLTFDSGATYSADQAPYIDRGSAEGKTVRAAYRGALAAMPIVGNSDILAQNIFGLARDWALGYTPAQPLCGAAALVSSSAGAGSPPANATQLQVADQIIGIGKSLNIPAQGMVVALDTALTENGLTNSNATLGGAYGAFQQTPSAGWGTLAQVQDVLIAAESFYGAQPLGVTHNTGLLEIPNWESLPIYSAAQAVQRSGAGLASNGLSNYGPHVAQAQAIYAQEANAPAIPLPVPPTHPGSPGAVNPSGGTVAVGAGGAPGGADACATAGTGIPGAPGVYMNPYRAIIGLSPGRVDQGVDYGGAGPLYAMGNGIILNTVSAGWPGGAYISYRLTDGPAKDLVVYMAENITPTVQTGQIVTVNTVIGMLHNQHPNSETGWGRPDGAPDTMGKSQWHPDPATGNGPSTAFGVNFNELLVQLHCVSGQVNRPVSGTLPPGWKG